MKIDFEAFNVELCANSLALLETWIPGGNVVNGEYEVLNPMRADNNLGSFKINLETGRWFDFATKDKGGDLISLYAYLNKIKQFEAAKELKGGDFREIEYKPVPKRKTKEKLEQIFQIPKEAWTIAPTEFPKKYANEPWTKFPFVKKWPYHNSDGSVFGYIGRIETPDGKETIPVGYFKTASHSNGEWKFKSFSIPRMLYGLHLLNKRKHAQIFLVEGEKCAEALQEVLGDKAICITWPGGGNTVKFSDFSPLKDRSVIIWPDWDKPGLAVANELKGILIREGVTRVGCLRMDKLKRKPKKGWDCADLIKKHPNKPEKVLKFIKETIEPAFTEFDVDEIFPEDPPKQPEKVENTATVDQEKPLKPAEESDTNVVQGPWDQGQPPPEEEPPEESKIDNAPFRFLGYDHGIYFYLPNESQQVVQLRADQHSRSNLVALASVAF